MQLPGTKKRRVAPRLTDSMIDRIMIHAHREKRTLTTMTQILMEEGLDARDLLKKSEGEVK